MPFPPDFERSVNPISTKGADYAHRMILAPSDFQTFLQPCKGSFNNYVDKMRGGGGQNMSVFVHDQGIKTVHAGRGGGVKKW